jgi:hypothetical protein
VQVLCWVRMYQLATSHVWGLPSLWSVPPRRLELESPRHAQARTWRSLWLGSSRSPRAGLASGATRPRAAVRPARRHHSCGSRPRPLTVAHRDPGANQRGVAAIGPTAAPSSRWDAHHRPSHRQLRILRPVSLGFFWVASLAQPRGQIWMHNRAMAIKTTFGSAHL